MDIFLLIGQSNMAGRGRLGDVAPLTHGQIHMFRAGEWQQAVEPLHTDKATAGIGLGMSFAHQLVELFPTLRVGLVPAAVGGTALWKWMPDADLYRNAVTVCRQAIAAGGTLRGILWHQGEADAGDLHKATTYCTRLLHMLTSLRAELDAAHVPIVAGELGPFLTRRAGLVHYQIINDRLHLLQTMLPRFAVASAHDLTDNGDNLHFNSASLREFGRRYAAAYCRLM